jgi:hypothetical protein
VSTHFFNQVKGSQNSQNSHERSRSQVKAEEHLKEVEDAFNEEEIELDDGESTSIMSKIKRKASRHLKTSIYVHNTIAMSLNVFAVLTAPPFKLFPRTMFALYFLISLIVTYRFIYNYKSYTIFEFEDLYAYLKKKSNV